MACVNLIRSWTTAILHSFNQETDLLMKVIMKCVSINLWDILGCFHYILNAPRSIAIILMGKRELVALLNLSSWCLMMVERLFLVVPGGCLQFVIVVFPDHTNLLFLCFHEAMLSICN